VQRLAGDVLHDDEEATRGVADLEDLADEGMVERGDGERLAAKALARDRVGRERRRQHFDGHVALERRVPREEHLAHATGPQQTEDVVSVGEPVTGLHVGASATSRHGRRAPGTRGSPSSPPSEDCRRRPIRAGWDPKVKAFVFVQGLMADS